MYTYLKVTVAALRAQRLLHYMYFFSFSCFFFFLIPDIITSRLILFSTIQILEQWQVVLVRSFCFYVNVYFLHIFFFYSFIVVCLEGLTGSDVSLRGKVSRCRRRGIYMARLVELRFIFYRKQTQVALVNDKYRLVSTICLFLSFCSLHRRALIF